MAFLLASAVPVGAVVFWLLLPEEKRQLLAEKIPEGWGGRALAAGAAFGVMALLAWVALPAFHNASNALRALRARMASAKPLVRVLLFPVELLLGLVWFLLQLLFAIDAFLIVASALIGLLLAIRIVYPDFLPTVLQGL